jgi:putative oxidoreductase
MRFSLATALIYLATVNLLGESSGAMSVAQDAVAAAAAVFVILGLWTPVTASAAALDQIWIAFSSSSSLGGGAGLCILLGALCASMAMLGPGAWSLDARLFGRRRFPAPQPRGKKIPPKE